MRPILILGGGLAGSAAAIHLARAGRPVTLLERTRDPHHKVCGEFLSAEALDLLHTLGVNVQTRQAAAIHTVRLAGHRRLTEAPLPFAARSLTRRTLDEDLLQHATAAGATICRGATVQHLRRTPDGWQTELATGEVLHAQDVLLASGKHDLRGWPRPKGLQGSLVALKMYLRLAPAQTSALRGAVELLLHPHGYTGLQLVGDDLANLTGLVHRKHLATLGGGWPGLLQELKATNPHAATRLRDAEPLLQRPLALSNIPYGFLRRHAPGPGLYVVGDQAAVIPSFTGDGMSIALWTGLLAAQSLLANTPAETYQRTVYRTLRGQVWRATALSHALLQSPIKQLLTTLAHHYPNTLRLAAQTTRLPKSAHQHP